MALEATPSDPADKGQDADPAPRAILNSDAVFENGAAVGHILSFDRLGNVKTSFVASDLKHLGLAVGDRMEIACGENRVEAYLGESVFEVRLGEWVAFVSLEGRVIVSRSYGRAVTALETDIDEPIEIRPLDEPAGDNH
jgi:S-adenosylmethionine hydrolase